MKPVSVRERAGAVAMALGITFSIVWALASYAFTPPADADFSQAAARPTAQKGCS